MSLDNYAQRHNENYWKQCPEEFLKFLDQIQLFFETKFKGKEPEYLNEAIEDNELWYFLEEEHNQELLKNEDFEITEGWIGLKLNFYCKEFCL